MTGNDTAPPGFRPELRDLRVALALLTRLPLPHPDYDANDPRPAAYAAWAYPIAGMLIAWIAALVAVVSVALGLSAPVAALIALGVGTICTGAMHEDGLADCADGFWGAWTRERQLEIMKDSQIGTYGVIALILSFGLRWAALSGLMAAGAMVIPLVSAAVISRAAMVGVMYALPNARPNGLSRQTGTVPKSAALVAVGVGLIATLFVANAAFLALLFWVVVVTIGCALIARAKIGGQTGDVLGATQQIIEITVLLACLAAL